MVDDNKEIIDLINERMSFGADKYGHGVQVDDSSIDWETMMMEEALDGMIYAAAQLIRLKRMKTHNTSEKREDVDGHIVKKQNAKYTCECEEFEQDIKVAVIKSEGCEHITKSNV